MTQAPARLPVELAFLGLLALLWGSSYLFIRIAVAEIPPVTLIAFRVSVAALFLLAVVLARRLAFPRDPKVWLRLLLQSFLNATAAWTILAWGQQHIDSATASVLNSTSPLFVFAFAALVTRHESTGAVRLAGALLGFAGVVLIMGNGPVPGQESRFAGQAAALAGAMLYAGAAIHGRHFSSIPAPVTAAATMLWSSLFLVPASLVVDRPWTLTPSAAAIGAATVLSVFCTGFALLIYFRLIRTLGSMGTASQAYLRCGVGVLLGVVLLGEELPATTLLGIAAAILGVALINRPAKAPGLARS